MHTLVLPHVIIGQDWKQRTNRAQMEVHITGKLVGDNLEISHVIYNSCVGTTQLH